MHGGCAHLDGHLAAAAGVGQAIERLGAGAPPHEGVRGRLPVLQGHGGGFGLLRRAQRVGGPRQRRHGLRRGQQACALARLPLEGAIGDLEGEQRVPRRPVRLRPRCGRGVLTKRQQPLDAVGRRVGVGDVTERRRIDEPAGGRELRAEVLPRLGQRRGVGRHAGRHQRLSRQGGGVRVGAPTGAALPAAVRLLEGDEGVGGALRHGALGGGQAEDAPGLRQSGGGKDPLTVVVAAQPRHQVHVARLARIEAGGGQGRHQLAGGGGVHRIAVGLRGEIVEDRASAGRPPHRQVLARRGGRQGDLGGVADRSAKGAVGRLLALQPLDGVGDGALAGGADRRLRRGRRLRPQKDQGDDQ